MIPPVMTTLCKPVNVRSFNSYHHLGVWKCRENCQKICTPEIKVRNAHTVERKQNSIKVYNFQHSMTKHWIFTGSPTSTLLLLIDNNKRFQFH